MFDIYYQLKRWVCFPFIYIYIHTYILSQNSSLMLKRLSFYGFQRKDNFESVVMEHLRMNGAYWGLTTLDLLGKLHTVDVDEVVSWLMSCQHDSGSSVFYLFPYFLLDISVIHSFLRENVLLWRGIWWKCWTWFTKSWIWGGTSLIQIQSKVEKVVLARRSATLFLVLLVWTNKVSTRIL